MESAVKGLKVLKHPQWDLLREKARTKGKCLGKEKQDQEWGSAHAKKNMAISEQITD